MNEIIELEVDFEGEAVEVKDPTIPTKTSQLENDSGFITKKDIPKLTNIPTKTSDLENDSGFITAKDIPEVDLSNYATKDMLPKTNIDDVVEKLSGTVNVYEPITDGWVKNAGISSTTGEILISESLYKNNVVTPLIPVVQDTLYSFTGQNDGMIYCYKENGEYIGYSLLTGVIDMESASTFYHHGQTLALTTYIRFVTNLDTDLETTMDEFNSTFMLCKGMGVPSEYVGFDEGGYLYKDKVYLSDKRIAEIAEKAALMLDEALSEILGSGEVEEDA